MNNIFTQGLASFHFPSIDDKWGIGQKLASLDRKVVAIALACLAILAISYYIISRRCFSADSSTQGQQAEDRGVASPIKKELSPQYKTPIPSPISQQEEVNHEADKEASPMDETPVIFSPQEEEITDKTDEQEDLSEEEEILRETDSEQEKPLIVEEQAVSSSEEEISEETHDEQADLSVLEKQVVSDHLLEDEASKVTDSDKDEPLSSENQVADHLSEEEESSEGQEGNVSSEGQSEDDVLVALSSEDTTTDDEQGGALVSDEALAKLDIEPTEVVVQECSPFLTPAEKSELYKEIATDIAEHLTEARHKIYYDYTYQGQFVARDEIHCVDATRWIADVLQEQSLSLKEKYRKDFYLSPTSEFNVWNSICYTDEALKKVKNKMEHDAEQRPTKVNWYDSRYFRYLLNLKPSQPYAEAIANYSPGPINFRLQQVQDYQDEADQTVESKREAWFRLGVITDLTNGWTNLRELKEMQKDKNMRIAKIKKLIKRKKKYAKNPRICQSLDYAIQEVRNVDQTVVKRRLILRDQMVLLTLGQLMQNQQTISTLKDGDNFSFVHLGLLNEETKSVDPCGWAHYEGNEMLDMCEVFKEFKGKQVVFEKGLSHPYVDGEGNFHIAKESDEGPNSIVINPIFFNVSVQGNTKNTPIQAAINKRGEQELTWVLQHQNNPFIKKGFDILKSGESSYDVAFYLAQGLLEKKMPLSFGCLSAKDRTGILGEFLVRYFVKNQVEQKTCQNKVERAQREKYYKKLFNGALSTKNNAAKVIKQNTGANIIKTTALLNGKINPVDLKLRLEYYHDQFVMKEPLV